MEPGDHLIAKVPIYGTKDAGRGFWKALREALMEAGLKENLIMKSLYSYAVDGEVKCVLGTHVDDILWVCQPEAQHLVDETKKRFVWSKEEKNNFRYCGKDVVTEADGTIRVSCKATILYRVRVKPRS